MVDSMEGMRFVFDWLSEIAAGFVSVVFSWQALAVAVVMPFVFYCLCRLIVLFRLGGSFDFNSFSGFLKSFSGKKQNRLFFSFGSKGYKGFSSFVVDGKRFYRDARRRLLKKRN